MEGRAQAQKARGRTEAMKNLTRLSFPMAWKFRESSPLPRTDNRQAAVSNVSLAGIDEQP